MPIYIGENKIVDCYLGDKLLEAVYIGGQKVYDPYTEITGTLPLSFNSRVAGALKNYRVYGIENGVGVQTINLLDVRATDTSNGYISDAYLTYQGVETESENYDVSEYIPILAETDYAIIARKVNSPGCCFYDATKQFISGIRYSNTRPRNFTTPTGAAYLRMTITRYGVGTGEGGEDMLLLGTYSEQPDFESYGYKIPLILTSGQNTDTYPLYIGSTKLCEEEYADFGEQKVYKRTANLYNKDAKDTNNGFVDDKYLSVDGSYTGSNSYWVSEYMPVDAGVEYTCIMGTFTNPSLCYYDDQKNYISGVRINAKPRFTTAPTGAKFVRISVRKTNAHFTCFVPGHMTNPDYFIPYLQPTDPPAPFPAIVVYKGENTLSDPMVQTEAYSFEQGNYGGNPGEQLFKHNSSHDYFNKTLRVPSILTIPAGQKWLIATKNGWATTIRIADSNGIIISMPGTDGITTNPIVIEASTSERKLGIHSVRFVNGSALPCVPSDYGGDLDITVIDAGALGSMMIKGRISETT